MHHVTGDQELGKVLINDTDIVAIVDIKLNYDTYIGHFLNSNGMVDEGKVYVRPYYACYHCATLYKYDDPEIGYDMDIKNARLAAAIVEAFDWSPDNEGGFDLNTTRIDLPTEEEAHKILKARGIDYYNLPKH